MTDNEATVAVPVSLLMNMSAIIGSDPLIAEPFKRQVHALLMPTPRRLRVVDLDRDAVSIDTDHRGHVHHTFDDLESAPDVMTLIEQVLNESGYLDEDGVNALRTDVRNAIEEATR